MWHHNSVFDPLPERSPSERKANKTKAAVTLTWRAGIACSATGLCVAPDNSLLLPGRPLFTCEMGIIVFTYLRGVLGGIIISG